ncbi:uncharacterized protein LOC117299210 [Asterias rubens]|uniref:uncharacterized protein LOC117299210 n=1 Tax=Asterias rubens TaxID=7604 RepID=UPI001455CBD4|nr:uncharacterized protein LOC117299210 [Asterias rubens]
MDDEVLSVTSSRLLFTVIAMANDPVFSLCMDMQESHEDVMDEVLEVIGPVISRNTSINDVVQETYVCQVLGALQTYVYVTGFGAKNLINTLKPLSELHFLPDMPDLDIANRDSLVICGFTLAKTDLQLLEKNSCLNDQVIHAYLEVLQKDFNEQSHQHVTFLPCHKARLWDNHQYNEWLYPNIPFADFYGY